MDRRGFLHGILALGAAPAIVRIGSLMPVKSIVIPTTEEVMTISVAGNSLLTIEQITREALRILQDNLSLVKSIKTAYDVTWDETLIRIDHSKQRYLNG